MKRQTNLMYRIVEMENLYSAWLKAHEGKQGDPAVLDYEKNLDENLLRLKRDLMSGNAVTGNYHFFTISDPKVRKICAAPFSERIMHHALMNICSHRFEKHLIQNSCATRKGKGTKIALEKATFYTKRFRWFVKLDIRKYFDTIDHIILKNKLNTMFKDKDVIELFSDIINSYQADNLKGVSIGNLTSQYFANHYLSQADHYATEQLKTHGYIRYMDDILFFGNDKQLLISQCNAFISFVEKTLNLEFKQIVHDRTTGGVPFLGYRLYPYFVRLNRRSKKRFKTKMRAAYYNLEQRQWSESDFQQHVLPLLAFTEKADTLKLRKNVLQHIQG